MFCETGTLQSEIAGPGESKDNTTKRRWRTHEGGAVLGLAALGGCSVFETACLRWQARLPLPRALLPMRRECSRRLERRPVLPKAEANNAKCAPRGSRISRAPFFSPRSAHGVSWVSASAGCCPYGAHMRLTRLSKAASGESRASPPCTRERGGGLTFAFTSPRLQLTARAPSCSERSGPRRREHGADEAAERSAGFSGGV